MAYNKLSKLRLLHLVEMLKAGRYPNHPRVLKEMRKYSATENFDVNQKTIKRDIEHLKREYGAPIAYDLHRKGFYLTDPNWEFDVLSMRDKEREAVLIGARLAEGVFPQPMGGRIRRTIDALVQTGKQELSEQEALMSLIVAGSRAPLKPEIFEDVFQGWRQHRQLLLQYTSAQHQRDSELLVEPQVLAFYEGNWYLKVRVLLRNNIEPAEGENILTLAVHRISNVAITTRIFTPDQTLVESTAEGSVFDLPMIENVRLNLSGKSAVYALELFRARKEYQSKKNGSVTIFIPKTEEYRLMNFILASQGEVEVRAPESLRQKVLAAAQAIVEKHS
ncbi:MAG: WYL domain-containing protein [Victivallales bacterium]|nr:WYL domain-containing protein [Victivallales bacterium]